MKLIYLHLYKDTYLIFMQAHKQLKPFFLSLKSLIRKKNILPKTKLFTINKIRVLIESKA